MDQEGMLDFKALRAKFQEEQILLQQPKTKPAVPEKPKVIPPPQSTAHYLPVGARPSLLTSINQSLEARALVAPRVIFKEDKKEIKKPLIQINSKGKDKSEGKLKKSKDKTMKGSKEKLDDEAATDQKPKKEKKLPLLPLAPKKNMEELVQATPPPTIKAPTSKKKGFLAFMKTPKRNSLEVPADPILDSPSTDDAGPAPLIPAPLIPAPLIPAPLIPAPLIPAQLIPAPLIPAPSDFSDVPPEPDFAAPEAFLPDITSTLPDWSAEVETETIPPSPDFAAPLAFFPDIRAPEVPTPEDKTPPEIETPALPVSRPASQNDIIPDPPSAAPTPPPSRAVFGSPLVASTPSPSPPEPEAAAEAVNMAAVEAPPASPPPATDSGSTPTSPEAEPPISPLSILSRSEDKSPGNRMSAADQRIFNALEKARKKISAQTNAPRSVSVTPPPEELPPSPTQSFLDLPPVDYEGNALPPKPVNGFDHSRVSPVLEGIAEEESHAVPERSVAPPLPPKRVIPDPGSLGPAPEKPSRPFSVNLTRFSPPVEDDKIPVPPEFSETDTTDVPEFDDVASETHSRSEWGNGEFSGPDSPDGQNQLDIYSNEMTPPGEEVRAAPTLGDQHQDNLPSETSISISQDSPPPAGLEAEVGNGDYEITESVYEPISISAAKKKGKVDVGKKRKGPPKNPYAEGQQEASLQNQEKIKTGRFGKNDKKVVAEGPDEKELRKKEKQRLEKEKKELKEKQEKEKKWQKEREKKENEMKKKFKVTGQEDAMYQAKVTVTNKGRKNDLPVTSGDIVSIIRTTNCPKGKWLARDCGNNYGYIAVDHVELDIKEMLELGKKAAITRMNSSNNNLEEEDSSTGNTATNHYPISTGSFSDDSEEWTGDDEDTPSLSPVTPVPVVQIGHSRTHSMPDMGNKELSVNHQHSRSDIIADGTHVQARHEALQKLTTFFHSPKPVEPAVSSEPETSPVLMTEEAVSLSETGSTQEVDADPTDILILPPPDLYADLSWE